jgi:hypothetical protein
MTDPRTHIITAITADARQDVILAAYAEHTRTHDLAASIDLAGEILGALIKEAKRIGRADLVASGRHLLNKHGAR